MATKTARMSFDDKAKALGQKTLKELRITEAKLIRIKHVIDEHYVEEYKARYSSDCIAAASDRWPYSPMMRRLVDALNTKFNTELTQWHVWEFMTGMRKLNAKKGERLTTGKQMGLRHVRSGLPMYDAINLVAGRLGLQSLERCGVSRRQFQGLQKRVESMHAAIMTDRIGTPTEAAFILDHWPGTTLFANFVKTVNHPKRKLKTNLQGWHVWEILLRMRKDNMLSMGGARKRNRTGYTAS
ncbi:hypothetical protein EBZ39_00385 [bacterium]|nr:hypothetical protein [bacterium]